ncbi:MAG: dephospho-CoA kinase [Rhodospirillales bacterium]|jgi:dephospho-CoA kinase|nr:dephospho-CoA kinase [Rhodospirillales bacterium]MBT4039282.1 dephospho-CoA kinase [Rhodospirillales bacterium]MBT4628234.1 dephospho-CoA kinase [Rhodospirillales bacterium]MBT5351983.1 dephospho-CoA kinase [Rhodospirillales bacterium]MBT5519447.1 dephospho-CoA kinase [Rhodospirillales bacterium]
MIILGLTGSIGMGKTTAAAEFRRLGVPVFDSDATVHALLAEGGDGVVPVSKQFTGVLKDGAIDRAALGDKVFGDPEALQDLEGILHPLVREAQARFLRDRALQQASLVVYDIPLLYETGAEARCDAVAIVSAPKFIQTQRVLARPGMDRDKLNAILARQTPDEEKRRRADFIIMTGLGRAYALHQIKEIVKVLEHFKGQIWPPGSPGGGQIYA